MSILDCVREYMPWLLSAVTIYMTIMAGKKHPKTWAVGLVNQVLWLIWIFATQAWGLLPMNAVLWVVYIRNHIEWNNR